MHILITADAIGGVWTYARELVTGLVRRDHRVTLVSFGKLPTAEQTKWMEDVPRLEFYPTDFRLEWMQDSAGSVEESRAFLRDFVQRVRPDILHLNQFCYGDLSSELPRIVVAHSDVLSWWSAVYDAAPEENDWTRCYREVVTRGLRGATVVVTPSKWMRDALLANYLFGAKLRVVYNGRSPELFHAKQKTNVALTVGRLWDRGKQASLLLEREQSVPVWIAGSDRHGNERFSSTEALNASARIYREQSEDRLRNLYSRASMYVATSRYEPFGLAPLEAAFSGCAVIANDLPSFREIWGDSAFYFRRNDPDSLADALRTLSQDDPLRMKYAERARSRALQHYTAEKMIDAYEELYRELSARGAAA